MHTDSQQLRCCLVKLRGLDCRIEPRMPSGESIADDYVRAMFSRCRQFAGAVSVCGKKSAIAGYSSIHTIFASEDIDDADRVFAFISDVFVIQDFRSQDVGKALLNHAEIHAMEHRASEMMVDVLASNHQARSLYLSVGFEEFALKLEKKLKANQKRGLYEIYE